MARFQWNAYSESLRNQGRTGTGCGGIALEVGVKKAVVLLSGGLDSSTVLAIARNQGFACHALTVAYGQRHLVELEAAARVAAHLGAAEHRVVRVDLGTFGGSSLTADIPVPLDRSHDHMTDIPSTYVPARNTVFLSLALAWALARVLDALTLGEATAHSLGMPLRQARLLLVAAMSLATAAAVAQMGLIAFVGLAAPHAVRSLVRCKHAGVLVLSALMGGALLLLADVLARGLLAPQDLPVGVLTAVLGGFYLLWRMKPAARGRS